MKEQKYVACKIHQLSSDWKEEKKANYIKLVSISSMICLTQCVVLLNWSFTVPSVSLQTRSERIQHTQDPQPPGKLAATFNSPSLLPLLRTLSLCMMSLKLTPIREFQSLFHVESRELWCADFVQFWSMLMAMTWILF